MSETRVAGFRLPIPTEDLVGVPFAIDGVGTYVCWPGEIETVNGIKIKHPPRWVRKGDHDKKQR